MLKEILEEVKSKLAELEADFKKEVSKFRTGRASVSILDNIRVDYFGTPTPLNQLATLSVPEANLIVIQPWDHNTITDIEKTIRNSNIDINPISDGKLIRLPVPPLDEERRADIIKTLRKYTEERKTSARLLRREYRELVRSLEEEKEISEDEERKAAEEIQRLTDRYVGEVDEVLAGKEKELMEI